MSKDSCELKFNGIGKYVRIVPVFAALFLMGVHIKALIETNISAKFWLNLTFETVFLGLIWAFLPLAILIFFAIYQYNFLPVIWTAERGIYVEFNRGRIFVPWDDIVAVDHPWYYIICTKKLTKLHYIYGFHALRLRPTIIVDPTMDLESQKKLIGIIKSNLSVTTPP